MRIPRSTPWCCCRTRPWSRCWCGCDGESIGERQPGDEVGVDRGSRGGVVFANRGAAGVRHEEVIPRQRESVGVVQPGDEVGVDRGSRDSVVLSNHIAVVVRHEEVVARQHESPGVLQPRDEVGVNHGSCGGVVFANLVAADLTDIDDLRMQ
jgi:hypothetical protein